jgi:hypothetical protein
MTERQSVGSVGVRHERATVVLFHAMGPFTAQRVETGVVQGDSTSFADEASFFTSFTIGGALALLTYASLGRRSSSLRSADCCSGVPTDTDRSPGVNHYRGVVQARGATQFMAE